MRALKFLFLLTLVLTVMAYMLQCAPARTEEQPVPTEQKVIQQDILSEQQISIVERDEPVNVYSDEIPLSNGWQCFTQDTCRRYGIDYALMLGLMDVESDFVEDADSGWAYGLCQIGYINEDAMADLCLDIYTNQGNIEAACVILSDYLSRYTTEQALICYNEGEYGAADTFADGIYSTKYSRSVLESAEKWRRTINGIN